jgi:hypothetical protein
MFRKDTVIILGAGASCDIGYPTGEQLIKDIINKRSEILRRFCLARIDIIAPSLYDVIIRNSNNHITFTKMLANDIPINFNSFIRVPPTAELSSKEENLKKEFETARRFFQVLQDFNSISIDRFLSLHSEFEAIGKFAIAYIIIEKEYIAKTQMTSCHPTKDTKNWYRYLLDEITYCKPEEILENKLNIITFNYDLSLEYYLKKNLENNKYFKDHIAEFFLNTLTIHHVYGQVGKTLKDYKTDNYGKVVNFKGDTEKTNLQYIYKNSHKIEVVLNDKIVATDTKAKSLINKANQIFILGYGFLRENNKKIDLNNQNITAQRISYTNFEDSKILDKKIKNIIAQKEYYYSNLSAYDALQKDFSFIDE